MLEYSRPKKETLKSKGGSRINACQKRMMKIFKIMPEHQRLVHSLKPPIAGDFRKMPPIPLSPSYTFQIRAFPPSAWTLETVHHWLVWWPETHKVNEWEYCLGKPDLLYILVLLIFILIWVLILILIIIIIMKFLFLLVVLSLIVWQTSLVCCLQQCAVCAAEASEGRLPWCCTHRLQRHRHIYPISSFKCIAIVTICLHLWNLTYRQTLLQSSPVWLLSLFEIL